MCFLFIVPSFRIAQFFHEGVEPSHLPKKNYHHFNKTPIIYHARTLNKIHKIQIYLIFQAMAHGLICF